MTNTNSQSRLFEEAVREQIQLRLAIDGPTGGGKTWTALQLGRIIAGPDGPVALADTENRSSLRYAPAPGEDPERVQFWDPPYRFKRRDFRSPYNPIRLGEFIGLAGHELGPTGVLIVDSLTHFWNGEGGTLDVADQAKLRGASGFTAWQEATPVQRYLLDAMVNCPCHLIVTMRSKMSYEIQQTVDDKGAKRTTIERMGLQPEQRPGIEYEFDVVASMDQSNRLQITKSRIPNLMGIVFHAHRSHEVGLLLSDWLSTGAELADPSQVEAFLRAFASITEEADRRRVKAAFLDQFGNPRALLASRVEEAAAWILDHVPGLEPEPAEEEPAKPKRRRARTKPTVETVEETSPPGPEPDGPAAALAATAAHEEPESDTVIRITDVEVADV